MSEAGTKKAIIGPTNLSIELGNGAVVFIEDSLGNFSTYNLGYKWPTHVHIITPLKFTEELPFNDIGVLEYECKVIPNLEEGFNAGQMPKTFPAGMVEQLKITGKQLAPNAMTTAKYVEETRIEHEGKLYEVAFIYQIKHDAPQDQ
jgi:hypothetical protein